MGKGDKRTRRGKIFKSSYGNSRKQGSPTVHHAAKTPGAAAKKTPVTKKGK